MASEPPVVPIIGGGPAGMSCALWLHNYGLHPVIIEKERALGGIARMSPYPNEWLLGQRGKTARENAAEFAAHIHELGIETWLGVRKVARVKEIPLAVFVLEGKGIDGKPVRFAIDQFLTVVNIRTLGLVAGGDSEVEPFGFESAHGIVEIKLISRASDRGCPKILT